jgi:outer membrane protein
VPRRCSWSLDCASAAATVAYASFFGLAGCASSSLVLAPEAPDAPFKPKISAIVDNVPVTVDPARVTATGARDFGLPPMSGLPIVPEQSPAIDPQHIYTLAELIDLAQTNNPDTRIAWERARQAALGVGMVKALYLPALTATAIGGGQRETGSTQVGNLPATKVGNTLTGAVPSIALQWLIFDFGERDALKRAAQDLSLASNIAFNGAHQRIIYTVSRNFFEYGSARRRSAIAEQSRTESAHILDAASNRFKSGVGTTVETAQARQSLAQAEFSLVQAHNAERDSYHQLLAAVGLSPMLAMKVEDVSRRPLSPASQVPVDRVLTQALARRHDIQAGYATARSAKSGIDAAKADLLPKVFVQASDTYLNGNLNITSLPTTPSLGASGSLSSASPISTSIPLVGNTGLGRASSSLNNATILGGVTIPLYDGGVREARVREAQSRADAAEATVLRLEQAATTEIVAADDSVRGSLAAYRAAAALVAASTTAQDAALSAYKSGAGTLTAALEAQRVLLSARIAQAEAHGTALISAATLAFATGRLSSSDALEIRSTSSRAR